VCQASKRQPLYIVGRRGRAQFKSNSKLHKAPSHNCDILKIINEELPHRQTWKEMFQDGIQPPINLNLLVQGELTENLDTLPFPARDLITKVI
jgi:hypothetical protein